MADVGTISRTDEDEEVDEAVPTAEAVLRSFVGVRSPSEQSPPRPTVMRVAVVACPDRTTVPDEVTGCRCWIDESTIDVVTPETRAAVGFSWLPPRFVATDEVEQETLPSSLWNDDVDLTTSADENEPITLDGTPFF